MFLGPVFNRIVPLFVRGPNVPVAPPPGVKDMPLLPPGLRGTGVPLDDMSKPLLDCGFCAVDAPLLPQLPGFPPGRGPMAVSGRR